MKYFKTFYKSQTAICLKKNIQSPHQIKNSYVSGTKIFEWRFTGIYRHLLSKCSENAILGHLEMVQRKWFFLAPIRNMFSAALREYIFHNVE